MPDLVQIFSVHRINFCDLVYVASRCVHLYLGDYHLANIFTIAWQRSFLLSVLLCLKVSGNDSPLDSSSSRPIGSKASASVEDCRALMLAVGCLATVIVTLTSLPLLFRIRAIFNDSTHVVTFFSILWIIHFFSSLVIPLGLSLTHTQSANVCTSTRPSFAVYTIVSPIVSLVHDTCIFIAISARLTTYSWKQTGATVTWKEYLVSFLSGREKELISRAVLETGQLHYMCVFYDAEALYDDLWRSGIKRCTVSGTIACMVCMFIPTVPASTRIALMAPNLVFQNVMACRAFRSLKVRVSRAYNGSSTSTISPCLNLPSIRFTHSVSSADVADQVCGSRFHLRPHQTNVYSVQSIAVGGGIMLR